MVIPGWKGFELIAQAAYDRRIGDAGLTDRGGRLECGIGGQHTGNSAQGGAIVDAGAFRPAAPSWRIAHAVAPHAGFETGRCAASR